jgi:hypothetical protein
MVLLGVTRLQCYLNETFDHANLNYVSHRGEVLGEMEGGGFEKDKMPKFTGYFLFMINVLNPVYLKVS